MDNLTEYRIRSSGYFDSHRKFRGGDGTLTPDRLLDCYELEVFLSDGGEVFINGVGHEIKRGCVIVSKPGDMRYSRLHIETDYIRLDVYSEYMCKYFDACPNFIKNTDVTRIKWIIDEITEENEKNPESLYTLSLIYELLRVVLHTNTQSSGDKVGQIVLETKKYMERNYRQKMRLEDVAGRFNLSPEYFHRLFKKKEGITPMGYLRSIRLNAAKKMLETTGETIERIGELCGFSSSAYFCDFFKKQIGVSPSKFRENKLKDYKI